MDRKTFEQIQVKMAAMVDKECMAAARMSVDWSAQYYVICSLKCGF